MISLHAVNTKEAVEALLAKDDIGKTCYLPDKDGNLLITFHNQYWFQVIQKDHMGVQETVGLLLLKEFSNYCVVFHGGIYKKHRGKNSIKITRAVLDILAEKGLKVITTIPSNSKHVIKHIKKLGFKYKMTIKDGCHYDDLQVFGED